MVIEPHSYALALATDSQTHSLIKTPQGVFEVRLAAYKYLVNNLVLMLASGQESE